MKTFSKVMLAVSLILGTMSVAEACPSPKPKNCVCNAVTNTWQSWTTNNNSNKNSNTNKNSNSNTNNNSVSNKNDVTVSATGGKSTSSATATGGSSSATIASGAVQNSVVTSSTASATGAGANDGNGSNNTTIETNYRAARIPVATAYAASLTSGMDTCLGSASGGGQTGIFGLSLGGTHSDKNCILVKQVQLLQELGMPEAACFRARAGKEGADIDKAMSDAGIDCKSLTKPVVVVAPAPIVASPNSDDVVTHEELNIAIKKVLQK